MNYLKAAFKRVLSLPLFSKLVLVNILLVALPLIVIVAITSRQITYLNQEEFSKYSAETVHQVSKSVSVVFNELNLLSNIVLSDNNIQEALSYPKEGYEQEKLEHYNRINSTLNVVFNSRMSYTSLIIYGYNQQLFYRGISSADYYFDFDHLAVDFGGIRTKKLVGSHYRKYATDGKLVFTLAMPIKSTSDFRTLGYMLLDLDYGYFDALINEINYADNSDIMILNGDQVLYSKNRDNVHTSVDASIQSLAYSSDSGGGLLTIGGATNYYSFYPLDDTGWKVVSVHPFSSYTNKTTTIYNFMLTVAGISLLVSILILVMISSAITKPLNQLTNLMASVQNGNFNVRFAPKYNDEVGKLGTSFNYMVSYTNTLIDNVYKMQIAEKEATIFALQSQINPHFLYNTLQMISDFAATGDSEEVTAVCNSLSSIFRYSIDGRERFVRLRDELEHVNHYVYIQSIRLNRRFSFQTEIPGDCYGVRIPRLILQPLVENSIAHGIYDKLEGAAITVTAKLEGGSMEIQVRDNGVGMDAGRLAEIREHLEAKHANPDFAPGAIGVSNVNRRLILSYGAAYGLKIDSERHKGTVVTIRVPLNQANEENV